jgi:hypothetical protein
VPCESSPDSSPSGWQVHDPVERGKYSGRVLVLVDGVSLTAADLVSRARAIQSVFETVEREVLDVVESDASSTS